MLQRCSGMVELGLLLLSECHVGERLRYRGAQGWWSRDCCPQSALWGYRPCYKGAQGWWSWDCSCSQSAVWGRGCVTEVLGDGGARPSWRWWSWDCSAFRAQCGFKGRVTTQLSEMLVKLPVCKWKPSSLSE